MTATTLLEDSFEFKGVPFLVKVQEREMYINAEKGRVTGVNMYGAPSGRDYVPAGWVMCDCIVAKVRPDYPFNAQNNFPDNVEKHHKAFEPLEYPEKSRGILFKSWNAVHRQNRDEVDIQALAERAVDKLLDACETRTEVAELNALS